MCCRVTAHSVFCFFSSFRILLRSRALPRDGSQDMERYFAWHRALEAAAHDLNLPMITVIYEDLLSDPEPRLKRLLKFMCVDSGCYSLSHQKSCLWRNVKCASELICVCVCVCARVCVRHDCGIRNWSILSWLWLVLVTLSSPSPLPTGAGPSTPHKTR